MNRNLTPLSSARLPQYLDQMRQSNNLLLLSCKKICRQFLWKGKTYLKSLSYHCHSVGLKSRPLSLMWLLLTKLVEAKDLWLSTLWTKHSLLLHGLSLLRTTLSFAECLWVMRLKMLTKRWAGIKSIRHSYYATELFCVQVPIERKPRPFTEFYRREDLQLILSFRLQTRICLLLLKRCVSSRLCTYSNGRKQFLVLSVLLKIALKNSEKPTKIWGKNVS